MNKLIYLILASMMSFLYSECSNIENQTECEAVGCEWIESNNMPGGYCSGDFEDDEDGEDDDLRCEDIENQTECEAVGCEWIESNNMPGGYCSGDFEDDEDGEDDDLRCEDIENQTECEAVGCEWIESIICQVDIAVVILKMMKMTEEF